MFRACIPRNFGIAQDVIVPDSAFRNKLIEGDSNRTRAGGNLRCYVAASCQTSLNVGKIVITLEWGALTDSCLKKAAGSLEIIALLWSCRALETKQYSVTRLLLTVMIPSQIDLCFS